MEIILAREMGFCFGVRRAVDMMEDATGDGSQIVSLGSVVHNPQVVTQLKERGLDVIATLEEVSDRPVAITAHGVGESVVKKAVWILGAGAFAIWVYFNGDIPK